MRSPESSLNAKSAPGGRPSNLGEAAYERMTAWLIGGQFRAGAKLTVRAVADALGVSTTPARDAINRLIGDGALMNTGPKTVVLPKLTMKALEEVSKIRLALEGLASFEGAANVTAADISKLEDMQRSLDDALVRGDQPAALACNREFHFLVYQRSDMPHLVATIASQWLRIGPSLNDVYPRYRHERKKFTNHLWIIEGLKDRDCHAVRAGFENDIRVGRRLLLRHIQSQTGNVDQPQASTRL